VVVADFYSFAKLGTWWTRLDVLSKTAATLVYAAAMWFLAAAVASQWRGIARLFEGYPAKRLLSERAPGTAWHTAHRIRLWVGIEQEHIDENPESPGLAAALDGKTDFAVARSQWNSVMAASLRLWWELYHAAWRSGAIGDLAQQYAGEMQLRKVAII
jgi:hypothetical protein